ncbi:hypothetical protein HK101_011498 [Irineochytrium annulatum]|nr:hypothetical protein HK101_011498 [Irineochytrium annulatum]
MAAPTAPTSSSQPWPFARQASAAPTCLPSNALIRNSASCGTRIAPGQSVAVPLPLGADSAENRWRRMKDADAIVMNMVARLQSSSCAGEAADAWAAVVCGVVFPECDGNKASPSGPDACTFPCPALNSLFPPDRVERDVLTDMVPVMIFSALCAACVLVTRVLLRKRWKRGGKGVGIFGAAAVGSEEVATPYSEDREWGFAAGLCAGVIIMLMAPAVTIVSQGFGGKMEGGVSAIVCMEGPGGLRVPADGAGNKLCLFQGVFFILGSYVSMLFAVIIILNAHLKIVWMRDTLERHHLVVQISGWLLGLILTALPLGQNPITGDSGLLCTLSTTYAFSYLILPQGILACGSFVLHFASLLAAGLSWRRRKNTRNSVAVRVSSLSLGGTTGLGITGAGAQGFSDEERRRHWIRQQFRLCWRESVLCTMFLFGFCCLTYVSVQYRYSFRRFSDQDWMPEWVQCLKDNYPNGQAACADLGGRKFLNLPLLLSLANLSFLQGFYALVVFMSHPAVLGRAIAWLRGRRRGFRSGAPCSGGDDDARTLVVVNGSLFGTVARSGSSLSGTSGSDSVEIDRARRKEGAKLTDVAVAEAVGHNKPADETAGGP